MSKENMSQEFRLKNVDETRNYLIAEIYQNEIISKKHKKVCTTINYIEHFLILASATTGCVSSWYSNSNYEFYSRIENLCNDWS